MELYPFVGITLFKRSYSLGAGENVGKLHQIASTQFMISNQREFFFFERETLIKIPTGTEFDITDFCGMLESQR